MDEKTLQQMIENGELGTMTECAYGSSIADNEKANTLKKKDQKETSDEQES